MHTISAPTPTKPSLLDVNQLALLKAPWPDVPIGSDQACTCDDYRQDGRSRPALVDLRGFGDHGLTVPRGTPNGVEKDCSSSDG